MRFYSPLLHTFYSLKIMLFKKKKKKTHTHTHRNLFPTNVTIGIPETAP